MLLKNKRIFVVEDDAMNLAVICTLLRKDGAEVEFDTWGGYTVQKLKDFRPFDLILLDLALPKGRSGYDVFDQIRRVPELAGIPVVVVTAADPGIEMNRAREKGLNGFISKPISYDTFAKTIAAVFEGKQVWGADDI